MLPRLDALTVSGAGRATVEKPVGDELKVKLSGAGTVNLREITYKELNVTTSGAGKVIATGAATRTQFKLSGAGGIDAVGLRSSFADVQVSGAGQATLDLSDLTFVDSSGLHAIVDFVGTENGNGPLILEGVSAKILQVLEITKVAEHPNLEIKAVTVGR